MTPEEREAILQQPRMRREFATIQAMLRIYCRDHHGGSDALCTDCQALSDYAEKRLAFCPFGDDKPTCVNCQVHCYAPKQREEVRVTMRYAGPRMLTRHPILAIRHLIDGKRPAPPNPKPKKERKAAGAAETETEKAAD